MGLAPPKITGVVLLFYCVYLMEVTGQKRASDLLELKFPQ